MEKFLFTSEAVCEGHPDKICDKISDFILDEALKQDPYSKMAVEVSIKDHTVFVFGEATTKACLDYFEMVHLVLQDIGYSDCFEVIVRVSKQSLEITKAVGIDEIKAGDQGIMFGYACLDTKEYMPLPIVLANALCFQLSWLRKNQIVDFLYPDGKSQVTVEYENGIPKRVDTILLAVCHKENVPYEKLNQFVLNEVIKKVVPSCYLDGNTKILINTSGSFVIGGSVADSGTTGRKIVSDTYGGMGRVGGGALSSKDPSKVDRSGAYYARYVAKNIVFHGLADICEIQVSYAIGKGEILSLYIDTKGTNHVEMEKIYQYVDSYFDFTVSNIIFELDLLRPIYYNIACYGHFGRSDLNLPWEKIKNTF